jgi:hypothetical protein
MPEPTPSAATPARQNDDVTSSAISSIPDGALTPTIGPSNAKPEIPLPEALENAIARARRDVESDPDDKEDEYKDFDWQRFPQLQKPSRTSPRNPSWVWAYGYRCQKRSSDTIIFVCKYCHQNRL